MRRCAMRILEARGIKRGFAPECREPRIIACMKCDVVIRNVIDGLIKDRLLPNLRAKWRPRHFVISTFHRVQGSPLPKEVRNPRWVPHSIK